MSYTNRDVGLTHIQSRKTHRGYGMGLGVLLIDDAYPGFPGDMRNASAYPFPIQYEIVQGVNFDDLIFAEDKTPCLEPILQAAKNLERLGCRAIAAECGYFAYFQKAVASAVDIPVFMSSLLQVPLAQQLISKQKTVGILVALQEYLTNAHLEAVDIQINSNYVVAGIRESGYCPTFIDLYQQPEPALRQADYAIVEQELVRVAAEFYAAQPNMGALVIECGSAQPFARAIQRRLDLPVFSWGTLLDYAYSIVVHRDYYGHV